MITIEELYDMITPENYIEIGNCIYFYGKDTRLDIDFLCRVEIMHKKEYCSIKNGKKMFLSSEEHMNDFIQRKRDGVRGYKTMKIGYIEDRFYVGNIEKCIVMNDGSHGWWIDRENNIVAPMISEIRKNISDRSTEFIKAA